MGRGRQEKVADFEVFPKTVGEMPTAQPTGPALSEVEEMPALS